MDIRILVLCILPLVVVTRSWSLRPFSCQGSDGTWYKLGDNIPTDDICQTGCRCTSSGVVCQVMQCQEPGCVDAVYGETCCGTCPNGLNCYGPNWNVVPVGDEVPLESHDGSAILCTCTPYAVIAECIYAE